MIEFIKKLRGADDTVKRRWLILASAGMMIVVIFLWLQYFNTLVQPGNTPVSAEEGRQGLTFGQTFRAGLGAVSQTAAEAIKSWVQLLRSPKDYTIQP